MFDVRNIKPLALAVVVIASICWTAAANAIPITWQLSNVFFTPSDGGREWTGSFVFDATTGTITKWNISVPGGVVYPQTIPPYTYTSSSPTASASYMGGVIMFGTTPNICDSSQPQRCLILNTTPLPEDGGEVAVSLGQESFTPAPFDTFHRTIDISKNPQLISTSNLKEIINPPILVRTTTWGHYTSGEDGGSIRGLAYDGHCYYIADHSDFLIDGRPWDFTGRIYIYDENGFVKRLPENPPIFGTGFPHGVATDGTKLWTTDYFGGNIYEYEIASGQLLRTFISPISQPIRLDFDAITRTLWMTGYDNPNIYQVDLNGTIVSSFHTSGLGLNKNVALDGKGGMLVASSEGSKENIHLLRRYSLTGTLLEEYSNFYTAYWAMATNINDRRSDFIQDTEPISNSNTGKYEAHIKHYSFPEILNDLVTFEPIKSTYQTTSDTTGCLDHIDDFTEHTYVADAGPIGTFADFPVQRTFDKPITSIRVTIVSGNADDIGYVGNIQVTPQVSTGDCSVLGTVVAPIDVTTQVTVSGNTARLLLRAQENCCCFTGWGSATQSDRQDARLNWEVGLAASVGQFSFDARLTNTSNSPLNSLVAEVIELTNNNLLQNADGGGGGVGARLTVQKAGEYADGVLNPGESVDVHFIICLTDNKPFRFVVDVLGLKEGQTDSSQVAAPQSTGMKPRHAKFRKGSGVTRKGFFGRFRPKKYVLDTE